MADDPLSPDDDNGASTVVAPKRSTATQQDKKPIPRYHVVLWDSDDHTYAYVMVMLKELFGHEDEKCFKLAETVDKKGRAVVLTTTREHAELKRDQIHAYGKDERMAGCKGSMSATIEEAD
ncbi:MAG: ATP-dependent Clp protease adaptor ClpS [Planctomycetales bacterium]|nr:ATP-dependent Clp protease adaptor ClpS [Planctomycetales bacterium]